MEKMSLSMHSASLIPMHSASLIPMHSASLVPMHSAASNEKLDRSLGMRQRH